MSALTFTHPALLWALGAAALPVLIHLINRHRSRRRPFAAIDFLMRVQRRYARRILLRQILLLAVRTMLIVALVIAAAGPVLRPETPLNQPGPSSFALVIDRSFSMHTQVEGQEIFERAIQKARAYVQSMENGDCAGLVSAGLKTNILVEACTDSHGTLLNALGRIEIEYGTSNLTEALNMAGDLLSKAPGPNRKIVLFTDGARHAFSGIPNWPSDSPAFEVVLEKTASKLPVDNHAVLTVTPLTRGRFLELNTSFVSYASQKEDNVTVDVWIAKEPLARGFVNLPEEGLMRKVFNIQLPANSALLGEVRMRPDALPQDDQQTFFVSGSQTLHALLVNGDMRPILQKDELYFLEHALAPEGEKASGISFTTITPDRFEEESLNQVDAVFMANVAELPPQALEALRRFVFSGGGLFIALGEKVNVDDANRMWAGLSPWPLRDIIALGPTDADGIHREGLGFSDMELTHPILNIFKGDELLSLKAVRTWRAAVVEPGQGLSQSRVLLRYLNGSPALIEAPAQNGRVILFTSSLDNDWNSWPMRATFLPFLQRTTFYLAGRLEALPPSEVVIGDPVRIPLSPKADGVRIERPDGKTVELESTLFKDEVIDYPDTTLPGFYRLEQTLEHKILPKNIMPGFLVRTPPSESNLRPITQEQLQPLLNPSSRLSISSADGRAPRSRTSVFLVLALLLCVAEAFLIRK